MAGASYQPVIDLVIGYQMALDGILTDSIGRSIPLRLRLCRFTTKKVLWEPLTGIENHVYHLIPAYEAP